jgi:hypothetical protein
MSNLDIINSSLENKDTNNYIIKVVNNFHYNPEDNTSPVLKDISFYDATILNEDANVYTEFFNSNTITDVLVLDKTDYTNDTIRMDTLHCHLYNRQALNGNPTEFEQVYYTIILVQSYVPITDRSGLFLSDRSNTSAFPSDTNTSKTYAQIMDETALTYANSNNVIRWSGGIDSTAVVASFIKNNIPFTLSCDLNSRSELSDVYDYLANTHTMITPNFEFTLSDHVTITGDCADQLYPMQQQQHIPDKQIWAEYSAINGKDTIPDYYKQAISDAEKNISARDYFVAYHSRLYQCDTTVSGNLYDNYLSPIIAKFPFDCQYGYQLTFYFRLIFKYQGHLNNLKTIQNKNQNKFSTTNTYKAFYDTEDFQRWAMTNYEMNYNTYGYDITTWKTDAKNYIHSVFNYDSVLNMLKYRSSYYKRSFSLINKYKVVI